MCKQNREMEKGNVLPFPKKDNLRITKNYRHNSIQAAKV